MRKAPWGKEDRYERMAKSSTCKSKSAIRIHRQLLKIKGTLFGRSFWAKGYCVSTVGYDEKQIKAYIKEQEQLQKEQDQLELDFD